MICQLADPRPTNEVKVYVGKQPTKPYRAPAPHRTMRCGFDSLNSLLLLLCSIEVGLNAAEGDHRPCHCRVLHGHQGLSQYLLRIKRSE
jgi:hypothetical protein